MNIAVLPNNKRELNEAWSDWPDVGLSFLWVFEPARRQEFRRTVASRAIDLVRYLQEHGYPQLGIASVPEYLYVREGPRTVGLDTYTTADVTEEVKRDPVAIGCYCEYDRHDAFAPVQIDTTRYVFVPMGALLAAGHSALVVSTAVSADFRAYSSAVRMEHTRAHMGAAAGVIVAMADRLRLQPGEVPYGPVRAKTARARIPPGSLGLSRRGNVAFRSRGGRSRTARSSGRCRSECRPGRRTWPKRPCPGSGSWGPAVWRPRQWLWPGWLRCQRRRSTC